jgi:hypothetical protein
MFAPSMLLTPAVAWTAVDDESFDVSMSDSGISATARVFVDEQGRMVDFSTTDRWPALPGGLTRARWTTPIDGWSAHGDGGSQPAGMPTGTSIPASSNTRASGSPRESVEFNIPSEAIRPSP